MKKLLKRILVLILVVIIAINGVLIPMNEAQALVLAIPVVASRCNG